MTGLRDIAARNWQPTDLDELLHRLELVADALVGDHVTVLDRVGVVPLGATVNMDGTALYEAAAALFVARLHTSDGPRLWLMDLKTNRSGIFGETALQLAAYRFADVLLPAGGGEEPMPPVDGCAAIHVRGDGYSLIPVTAGPTEHRLFLYAQQVAGFTKHGRNLVGAALVPPTTSTLRLVREDNSR